MTGLGGRRAGCAIATLVVAAFALVSTAGAAAAQAGFQSGGSVPADADVTLILPVPEERGDAAHNLGVVVTLPAEATPSAEPPFELPDLGDGDDDGVVVDGDAAAIAPDVEDPGFPVLAGVGSLGILAVGGTAAAAVYQRRRNGEA